MIQAGGIRSFFNVRRFHNCKRRPPRTWTYERTIWTIDRSVLPAMVSSESVQVTTPMLRGRMAVEFAKGTGKIKLIGKTQLIADGFDGQFRGIEQLDRALHAQMIQVKQRGIPGGPFEHRGVM